MRNVSWIIPNKLAARPGPSSILWSLPELRRAGFDGVLNLSEYAPDETGLLAAGFRSQWVPLPTTVPPRAQEALDGELAVGGVVLDHCVAGRDRTGTVLAHYLARSRKTDPALALQSLRELLPNAIDATGWEAMVLRVLTRLLSVDKF